MLTAFKKKSEEHEKLIGSLAKHFETLTERTRSVPPREDTKLCGRRLDFATPLDRPGSTQEDLTREKPDETTPAVTRKNLENLPPPPRETEDNEREQIYLDPSKQSDNSDEDVVIHPRKTRSLAARHDSSDGVDGRTTERMLSDGVDVRRYPQLYVLCFRFVSV